MKDIHKKIWDWHNVGINIGEKYNRDTYSLKRSLKNLKSNGLDIIGDHYSIYKVVDNVVTQSLTIKDAERLLKIDQL